MKQNMNDSNRELKASIGLSVAFTIVIGSVIGSGIFMKPGRVIALAGDSTMALLAWAGGGLITMAAGLTVVEIATKIPKTGGLYAYIEEIYGKFWGYLAGWVQAIFYGPASMGGLTLYFGSITAALLGWPKDTIIFISIATIALLTTANLLGTRYGGWIQNIATVAKLIPVFLIGVFGLLNGSEPIFGVESGLEIESVSFGAAILATLWAYDGWIEVGNMSGEIKNPGKLLPIAIIGGIAVVTITYIVINAAMMHLLPADMIVTHGENSAKEAASTLFGEMGGRMITVGVAVSMFGCLNGKILTFPRIPYAMALRGQLPFSEYFSKISPKYKTPVRATLLQVAIAIALMTLSNPDYLSEMAIFIIYIFYCMTFFGVFILRKRDGDQAAPYKVPLYPAIPIFAIMGAIFILISTLINSPLNCFLAFSIPLIGLVLYYLKGFQPKIKILRSERAK